MLYLVVVQCKFYTVQFIVHIYTSCFFEQISILVDEYDTDKAEKEPGLLWPIPVT